MYYQLGDFNKSLDFLERTKEDRLANNYHGLSHYKYWESLIKYNLGDIERAKNSIKEGLKNADYHNRFPLMGVWHFSDEQIAILENLENDINN